MKFVYRNLSFGTYLMIFFLLIHSSIFAQNDIHRLKKFEREQVLSDEKIKYYLESSHPEAIYGEELLTEGAKYLFFNQPGEALKYFKRYLEQDAENIPVMNLVGVCYTLTGEYDSALVYLDKVIDEFPGMVDLYCERGWVKLVMGDTLGGSADIHQAFVLDSNSYNAIFNLSYFKLLLGEVKASMLLLARAIEIEPEMLQAYIVLGSIYSESGDHRSAIGCYSQALEIDSSVQQLYLIRGTEYLELSEKEKAFSDFGKLDLGTNDNLDMNLGIITAALGDYQKSIFYLKSWMLEDEDFDSVTFYGNWYDSEFYDLLEILSIDSLKDQAVYPPVYAQVLHELYFFNYDTAQLLITEYIVENPDAVLAKRLLALSLFHLQEAEELEKVVNELVLLDTTLVFINAIKALRMEMKGDFHASKLYSRRALNAAPDYHFALNLLAWAEYKLGNYAKVLNTIDRAIELKANEANQYNTKGLVLHDQKKYEESIRCFNKALHYDPNFCHSLSNKAMVLITMNDLDSAEYFINKCTRVCPDFDNIHFQKARLYGKRKMFANGVIEYTKYLEAFPNDPDANFNRGDYYYNMKEYSKALKDFQKVLDLNPNSAGSYYFIGMINMFQGNNDYAEECLLLALELAPPNSYSLMGLATFYIRAEDFRKAKKYYQEVTELYPQEPVAYSGLAYIAYRMNDLDESVKLFNKTLSLQPENTYAMYYVAYIKLMKGNFSASKQLYFKAYEIQKRTGESPEQYLDMLRYLIDNGRNVNQAKTILKDVFGLNK